MLLTESAGAWAVGVEATLPAGAATNPGVFVNSVSCASAGNCSAVGYYIDSSAQTQGVLLTESAGAWAQGVEATLPPAGAATDPLVNLSSVSCPSAGNCSAVGDYVDSSPHRQGMLLTESAGAWAAGVEATPPAGARTDPGVRPSSVSCPSAGNCSVVGTYVDSSAHRQGLLLGAAPASPTLTVTAPATATAGSAINPSRVAGVLSAGASPTGTIAFRVFGPRPSAPSSCAAGGTTVASAPVSGNATYHPAAAFTPRQAGHYWWFARYGGDAGDNPAASSCGGSMAETVVAKKPSCTLKPNGSVVTARALLSATKQSKKRPPKGVLKLTAKCNQAVQLRLTGAITAKSKPKSKTFAISPIGATAKANRSLTLTVKLPKAALKALRKGATESAAFKLTVTNANGTSTARAKIAKLKLAKK
jgi:hypothetical protein